MEDKIKKPLHYMFNVKGEDVELSDIIEGVMWEYQELRNERWYPGTLYFYINSIKYLFRWFRKNQEEDLKKAKYCIEKILEIFEDVKKTNSK